MSMNCKLDWLSFTWKSGNNFRFDEIDLFFEVFPEITNILVQSTILRASDVHGRMGSFYDHVLAFCDYFQVSYNILDMNGDMSGVNLGVNVSVPAHGLEFFFDLFGFSCDQVVEMLQLLRNRGCKFSRLDFAFDDYDKVFTPKDYTRWGALDQIVSSMKRIDHKQCAQDCGWTFYMGTRSNGKMLRIYDKEYQSKGLIKAIRYEFELHSKYTSSVVDWILEHKQAPVFTELLSWFIVKVVGNTCQGRNRAHMESLPEWDSFIDRESLLSRIDADDKVQLTATKSEDCANDVVKFLRWYKKQVAKRASALRACIGKDRYDDLMDSLEDQDANDAFNHYWNTHKKDLEKLLFDDTGNISKDWKDNIFKVS